MISGFFDPTSSWPVPRVRVLLFLQGITNQWVPVTFLLDTGASITCLHPRDAVFAMGINSATLAQPQYWPQHVAHQGIGGANTYYRWPAQYGFRHDDGTREIRSGTIDIAQLRADNQGLPSLLGWDVLQHFRVITDWPARQITLA